MLSRFTKGENTIVNKLRFELGSTQTGFISTMIQDAEVLEGTMEVAITSALDHGFIEPEVSVIDSTCRCGSVDVVMGYFNMPTIVLD